MITLKEKLKKFNYIIFISYSLGIIISYFIPINSLNELIGTLLMIWLINILLHLIFYKEK